MPNQYTVRLAPKKRVSDCLPAEILDMLRAWTYDETQPIPIRIQVCPRSAYQLQSLGLPAFQGWLRMALNLHPLNPIIIEVYR